ncbi:MAG: hypothetical protein ACP6IS_00045 [Candidatus Asgardarchaeia archaeon]
MLEILKQEYDYSLSKLMSISNDHILLLIKREIFLDKVSTHELKETSKPYWQRIVRLQNSDGSWLRSRNNLRSTINDKKYVQRRKLRLTLKNLENLYWYGFTKNDIAVKKGFTFIRSNIDSCGVLSGLFKNIFEKLFLTSWFYKISSLFGFSEDKAYHASDIIKKQIDKIMGDQIWEKPQTKVKLLEKFLLLLASYLNIISNIQKNSISKKVTDDILNELRFINTNIIFNIYHEHPTRIIEYVHLLEGLNNMKVHFTDIILSLLHNTLQLRYEDKLWYSSHKRNIDQSNLLLNLRILRVLNNFLRSASHWLDVNVP